MTPCARPRAPTCRSRRRRSGASRRSRWTSTRSTATSTRTCCSSCTGAGAASKARPGRRCCAMTSARAWSGCGTSRTYLHPRALLGFFPCYALGNDIVVLDPEDRAELTRSHPFVCPRQPKGDRICLADFFRPARRRRPAGGARRDRGAGGDGRLGGDGADGAARGRRRVRRAAVRARPRRADRGGAGRVAALRGAAHARHPAHAGPALLVGLPGGAGAVRAPEGARSCSTSARSA